MAELRPTNRLRTPLACRRCRQRKIKCSGNLGDDAGCTNCQRAEEECLFERVSSSSSGLYSHLRLERSQIDESYPANRLEVITSAQGQEQTDLSPENLLPNEELDTLQGEAQQYSSGYAVQEGRHTYPHIEPAMAGAHVPLNSQASSQGSQLFPHTNASAWQQTHHLNHPPYHNTPAALSYPYNDLSANAYGNVPNHTQAYSTQQVRSFNTYQNPPSFMPETPLSHSRSPSQMPAHNLGRVRVDAGISDDSRLTQHWTRQQLSGVPPNTTLNRQTSQQRRVNVRSSRPAGAAGAPNPALQTRSAGVRKRRLGKSRSHTSFNRDEDEQEDQH